MAQRPVDAQVSFPRLEEQVLARWRERDVFRESLRRREGAPPWVFWEGPPTANGPPGVHHVLSRAFKDIFPRFRTMRGYYVERRGGWDTHGLPVEIAVEKKLGIKTKAEIEEYGIEAFNAQCRESVFAFLEDWNALTERIGFWLDLANAYRTLDPTYIESVWWSLKQIADKGLLYEGHRVVPYCPRCGTALSSHEVALGYEDVEDPSVYVRFKVAEDGGPLQAGDELLIWTTTPWTLVSNAAVAVDPELLYVRAKTGALEAPVVLAEALVEKVLGDPAGVQIIDRFPGAALDGVRYEPPFHYLGADAYGERGHTVLLGDFVTADDGTGLVHTAIAFGEDDFRLGRQYGLNVVNPVRLDGTYDERIGAYAGRFVKDADADLVEDLRRRGRLLRAEVYEHSYPHCWRCSTPLLYYAKPSWYIATSQIRDELLAANEQVTWHPEHIKHGRFGNWLENNVDWALSRERYWGTPLPVWRCEQGHVTVIGSLDELEQRTGVRLEDPHRPFVDDVSFACDECGEIATRVSEVIDVWFDSGAMPFAQRHEPFAGELSIDEIYPADFICEALDQTRGWFYSLLGVSTLLRGPEVPYRNVVCLGLLLDAQGQKMSKSRGNVVAPGEIIDRFGADALRWYFFTSKQPWDGYLFSPEAVGEGVRLFLRQLWNTYRVATMYAPVDSGAGRRARGATETDLDRWIRSRLSATITTVTDRLDAYDATAGGRAIADFVDDLSNWYVRRSRPRFWEGDAVALETLRHSLVTVAQLLAPFTPFVADEIYDNLDGSEPSVHLTDWPAPQPRDEGLEEAMAIARETVRLGLAARAGAKIKVRQPLHEAVVVATGRERDAIARLGEVVREELNVKQLRFVSQADELGSYTLKPNYRTLGPRFGKAMPQVAEAVGALDADHVAEALRADRPVGIFIDGHDHTLGPDDLQLAMAPLAGYQLEREGSHAVALELTVDDDLRREGLAREIVHAVQLARREAGLDISDRIVLTLDGDELLLDAARVHEAYLSGEVLAVAVRYSANGNERVASIEGRELRISLAAV
jgi:isoleucyl-tRNA synthetase